MVVHVNLTALYGPPLYQLERKKIFALSMKRVIIRTLNWTVTNMKSACTAMKIGKVIPG